MVIKGIAFDLEGTCVDVELAHHKAHLKVAEEFGIRLTLEKAIETVPYFIGGPDEKIMEALRQISTVRPSITPAEMVVLDKKYYKEFLAEMPIQARAGLVPFLNHLKAQGYRISIGSLTAQEEAHLLLTKSGLYDIFGEPAIVLREHVKNTKPAPDVFLETARRMGIRAHEQLVFEDSPRGVQAALAAGSSAIGMPVYTGHIVKEQLVKAGAKQVYYSWAEVHKDFEKLIN